MIAFIDDQRGMFGVGPICRVLGIAPSTYHAFKAVERDSDRPSDRARQDRLDMTVIKPAFDESRGAIRRERCGINCVARGPTSPAARWNG